LHLLLQLVVRWQPRGGRIDIRVCCDTNVVLQIINV
jgi:hypothetical protein